MTAQKLVLIIVFCCFSQWALAETIHVAVASNFTATMKKIVAEFEKTSNHRVSLSFGSSGKFYAQIKNGAPFYVFFSADQTKPLALEQDGLIVPGSRFTYAIGALALWSSKAGLVDSDASVLKSGHFNKLALANPRLAPYGVAAVQVLEGLGLKDATQVKWVQGENIAQTWQFASSGNADIGFVALSQIMAKGNMKEGSLWIIPNHLYAPIKQDAVLLRRGKMSEAAQALLHFVRGETASAIIESDGYKTLATQQ